MDLQYKNGDSRMQAIFEIITKIKLLIIDIASMIFILIVLVKELRNLF